MIAQCYGISHVYSGGRFAYNAVTVPQLPGGAGQTSAVWRDDSPGVAALGILINNKMIAGAPQVGQLD